MQNHRKSAIPPNDDAQMGDQTVWVWGLMCVCQRDITSARFSGMGIGDWIGHRVRKIGTGTNTDKLESFTFFVNVQVAFFFFLGSRSGAREE